MLRCVREEFGLGQHQPNSSRIGLVRIDERVGSVEDKACPVQFREIDCRRLPLREVHRAHESSGDSVLR